MATRAVAMPVEETSAAMRRPESLRLSEKMNTVNITAETMQMTEIRLFVGFTGHLQPSVCHDLKRNC
jgi:hypothetical protein